MKRPLRRLLLLLPAILLVLAVALIAGGDAWLESAGGRRALEKILSSSFGMPVRLAGEFGLDVIPPIGVSGTDLTIGEIPGSAAFVRSGVFDVTLEVLPLLQGSLTITSLRLADGKVDPALYTPSPGQKSDAGKQELPAIRLMMLENFRFVTAADTGSGVLIRNLRLEDFRESASSLFELNAALYSNGKELVQLGAVGSLRLDDGGSKVSAGLSEMSVGAGRFQFTGDEGEIHWNADEQMLDARMAWREPLLGELDLDAEVLVSPGPGIKLGGRVEGRLARPGITGILKAGTTYELREAGLALPGIILELDGQSISGNGCLLPGDQASVQLLLESEFVDLDRLAEFMPAGEEGSAEFDSGLEVDIEINIGEAVLSGASAHGIRIRTGDAPDCSALPVVPAVGAVRPRLYNALAGAVVVQPGL